MGILKKSVQVDNLELTVLGSGHPDYEDYLRKLVIDLEIEDRVQFVRRVPRSEIASWLGKFDIFLFTSIWPEPMARTVMEAMAARMLVIGSRVGGQVEMLSDGENSLTFEPENSQELADQILNALTQPSRRIQLAQAGQRMVLERFTLNRMVDDIESWLQTILFGREYPVIV
jgi:glycosyltransferase involved in cell wall biosynthesis